MKHILLILLLLPVLCHGQSDTAGATNRLRYNKGITAFAQELIVPFDTSTASSVWSKKGAIAVKGGFLFYNTGNGWLTPAAAGTGVSSIVFTPPLTGGIITNTGTVGLPKGTGSQDGYLDDTDWNAFNSKQNAIGWVTEDVANKATSFSVLNNFLYPTTLAVNSLLNTSLAGYMPIVDSNLLALGYVTVTYVRNNYYPLTGNPAGYLTAASIAGKLNISDTAAMLSNYAASILLRVKYTDTAGMLSTYQHKADSSFNGGYMPWYYANSHFLTGYTETDPIFSASSAFGIASLDITHWNTAYTNRITSLTTTGSSGVATLSANVLNIPNYAYSWTSPISLSGSTVSISQANGSTAGYLSPADWTTFNNKGSGTVMSFTSGNLSPIFTTSVSTSTTTPALTYSLTAAASYSFLANFTNASATPTYFQPTGTPSATNFFRGDGSWGGAVTSVSSANGAMTITTASTTPVFTIVSAPKITTPRAINGTNFDGTAAITITASANTLTTTTLNPLVTFSSLTALGVVTTGTWTATPVASAYVGSLTGGQVGLTGLSATGTPSSSTFLRGDNTWAAAATGTVTTVTANALSPLFTSTTATNTTTPVISYSLSAAAAYTVFGNNTASSAAPSFFNPTLASAFFSNQGTTTTVLHGNASGNPSWGPIVNADITAGTIDVTTKITGFVPVANGGTGLGSLTQFYTLIGNGTSGVTLVAPSATIGYALTSNGSSANPSYQDVKQRYTPVYSATLTVTSTDVRDVIYTCSSVTGALTFAAPTGTWVDGQFLTIKLKDNATARALTFNAAFNSGTTATLPTTTTISKEIDLNFVYSTITSAFNFQGYTDGH